MRRGVSLLQPSRLRNLLASPSYPSPGTPRSSLGISDEGQTYVCIGRSLGHPRLFASENGGKDEGEGCPVVPAPPSQETTAETHAAMIQLSASEIEEMRDRMRRRGSLTGGAQEKEGRSLTDEQFADATPQGHLAQANGQASASVDEVAAALPSQPAAPPQGQTVLDALSSSVTGTPAATAEAAVGAAAAAAGRGRGKGAPRAAAWTPRAPQERQGGASPQQTIGSRKGRQADEKQLEAQGPMLEALREAGRRLIERGQRNFTLRSKFVVTPSSASASLKHEQQEGKEDVLAGGGAVAEKVDAAGLSAAAGGRGGGGAGRGRSVAKQVGHRHGVGRGSFGRDVDLSKGKAGDQRGGGGGGAGGWNEEQMVLAGGLDEQGESLGAKGKEVEGEERQKKLVAEAVRRARGAGRGAPLTMKDASSHGQEKPSIGDGSADTLGAETSLEGGLSFPEAHLLSQEQQVARALGLLKRHEGVAGGGGGGGGEEGRGARQVSAAEREGWGSRRERVASFGALPEFSGQQQQGGGRLDRSQQPQRRGGRGGGGRQDRPQQQQQSFRGRGQEVQRREEGGVQDGGGGGGDLFAWMGEGASEQFTDFFAFLDEVHEMGEELDGRFKIEFEPEYDMGTALMNPNIDETPPPSLEEFLLLAKGDLMAMGGMESEEEFQAELESTLARASSLEKVVEHYTGPQRKTAKQENEELAAVVVEHQGERVPPEMQAFTKRALLTLQNNPSWSLRQKKQLLSNIVRRMSSQ